MIQVTAESTLSIHLINTNSSSRNEVKIFKEFIDNCKKESDKPGFKNMFNDEQRELITNIYQQINPK